MTVLIGSVAAWLPATARGGVAPQRIAIELFVRADSEPCRQAGEFLGRLEQERDGLDIVVRDVLADEQALSRLWRLSRQAGYEQAKLPTFSIGDQLMVGYDDATTGALIRDYLTINVYIRPGCRHCHAAQLFLDEMVQRWPALEVKYHDAVNNPQVRREVQELLRRYNKQLTLFPCIHVANQIIVGFDSPATTGARIERLFQPSLANRQGMKRSTGPWMAGLPGLAPAVWLTGWVELDAHQIPSEDAPAPPSLDAPPPPEGVSGSDEAPPPPADNSFDDAPLPAELAPPQLEDQTDGSYAVADQREDLEFELFGRVHRIEVSRLGLPAFTFLVGLVDGFNPCAMWVLVFLLSILVNVKDRQKIVLIAGSFVLVSGIAYFAFMAAWLNVFQLIGLQRPVQIALGTMAIFIGLINVKDFFAFHRGLTFSIPESAKPGIYRRVRRIITTEYLTVAIFGAVALAIVVNIVELLCTAGLPAMYTEILTMHQLPAWQNYAYLLLYNVAYMLDDSILLAIIIVTLSRRRLQEKEGRWLKLLSGAVILSLGLAMVFAPDLLTWGRAGVT